MKGKRYPKAFKDEAIKLALSDDQNPREVSERLGISYSVLTRWIKDYKSEQSEGAEEMAREQKLQAEIKDLKKQLARAKEVEAILKKAAAYFVKEAQ